MASEENRISYLTNSDVPTKSIRPSANNDNNGQEDQQASTQETKILKNDDNSTCMMNRKRTFDSDSILEETTSESHVSSHDFDATVLKKVNTQTYSTINKNVSPPQLSSFSFKPSNRKERKLYKFMHKTNTSDNSTFQHDSLTDTSHSSQKNSTVKSKRIHSGPSKATRGRKKKSTQEAFLSKNTNLPSSSDDLFSDIRVFFIPNNIDKVRLRLLKQKVEERGGKVANDKFDSSVTHIITALEGQRVLEILEISDIPQGVFIVEPNWISHCLMNGKLMDVRPYIVQTCDILNTQSLKQKDKRIHEDLTDDNNENKRNNRPEKKQRQDSLSPKMRSPSPSSTLPEANESKTQSDDPLLEIIEETKCLAEAGFTLDDDNDESRGIQDNKTFDPEDEIFVSSMQFEENNPNQLIIDKLKVLSNHYQRMKDEWRTLSYRKAITAIKNQKEPITSYKEAIKIPGIGHRTAEKIAEIINTGNLKRLQHFSEGDEIIKKFGVGASTAMKWYAKGYRTFDDIIKNVKLTHAQRIGIEYFDDLQERIPRDEVTEISKRVKEAACKVDPDLSCTTVGSYIRGRPTCGDIDILVTKNGLDGKKDYGAFSKLLDILHEQGLLTHDLTQREETSSKYFGLCRLPGGKHRRIDMFIVPFNELGAALLSFTGNDIFNRSIRLLAKKKKMNLNHHGLYKNVSRGHNTKLNKGILIAQRTEKEIFDALGVPWR
ncbi:9405_t:CDS:10 [Cetraspora pellucida]|uniref:DNA polymerase lambda n=1 Tax=Cetraspora pellucida TaxID=1433469 RepID=A0A9N8WBV5_9GLOM|nr:9405_t:CDS:10 [Cetraspora pellucida]